MALTERTGQVYVATGNSYGAPPNVTKCLEDRSGDPVAQGQCVNVEGNWWVAA
jgi:hypothetical protein